MTQPIHYPEHNAANRLHSTRTLACEVATGPDRRRAIDPVRLPFARRLDAVPRIAGHILAASRALLRRAEGMVTK
jgi:hypothetical protein